MRDLTQGPITGNLLQMAMPIAVGMLRSSHAHGRLRADRQLHALTGR